MVPAVMFDTAFRRLVVTYTPGHVGWAAYFVLVGSAALKVWLFWCSLVPVLMWCNITVYLS